MTSPTQPASARSLRKMFSPRGNFSASESPLKRATRRIFESPKKLNRVLVAPPLDLPEELSINNSDLHFESETCFQPIQQQYSNLSNFMEIAQYDEIDEDYINTRPRSKGYLVYKHCCFCDELLVNNLPGERSLELTCGDQSHFNCYSMLLKKCNLTEFPVCNLCGETTKCKEILLQDDVGRLTMLSADNPDDEEVCDDLLYTKLEVSLESSAVSTTFGYLTPNISSSGSFEPKTPENQIIRDPFSTPTHDGNVAKILGPSPKAMHFDEQLYDKLNEPKLNLLTSQDDDQEDNSNLSCVLRIESPHFFNTTKTPEQHTNEMVIKQKIIGDIKLKLINQTTNWEEAFEDLERYEVVGDLLVFDYICIGTNAKEMERVYCFLFESYLVFLNEEGNKLVGKILISNELCNVNKLNSTQLLINLTNLNLPELVLSFDDTIIINKWESYLSKFANNETFAEIPLSHLTSNAWNFVNENKFEIPQHLKEYNELASNGQEIPMNFLNNEYIPMRKDYTPVNLVVAVPLVNATETMCNDEYKNALLDLLNEVLANLHQNDNLGIVFIGSQAQKNGTFTGFMESSWSGWRKLINEIAITDNRNSGNDKIFDTDLESLSYAMESCFSLLSFSKTRSGSANKIVFLDCNDFDYGKLKQDTVIKRKITNYTEKIINDYSYSITILNRRPDTFLTELNPRNQYNFINVLQVDNLYQVSSIVTKLINSLHEIVIPRLSVKLELSNTGPNSTIFSTIESPMKNAMKQIMSESVELTINEIGSNFSQDILLNFQIKNIDKRSIRCDYSFSWYSNAQHFASSSLSIAGN